MTEARNDMQFPRPLLVREREWIEWVLPADRPGYRAYRDLIGGMLVLGEGRRGEGELILGHPGTAPDFSSPLAPLFAYGAIDTSGGIVSISLREMMDGQISIEIVGHGTGEIPSQLEERARWTYSLWNPGDACPQCGQGLREVPMHSTAPEAGRLVLALCATDRRLWVYDPTTGVNRLIPVTNFYNELMLHKNIREPEIALNSRRLFTDLPRFSDSDLAYAFLTYNKIRTKVHVSGTIEADRKEKRGFGHGLLKLFTGK
jgi:hypothetical protein